MTVTASEMLPLGTKAPDFNLTDTEGNIVSLSDFNESQALLVIFMCNHCPFVKHILDPMIELAKEYQAKGASRSEPAGDGPNLARCRASRDQLHCRFEPN